MYVASVWGDLGTEWRHNFPFYLLQKIHKRKDWMSSKVLKNLNISATSLISKRKFLRCIIYIMNVCLGFYKSQPGRKGSC